MKLRKAEDTEDAEFLAALPPKDQITPYATLLIFNLSPDSLKKVAPYFGLTLEDRSSFQVLKTKNSESGEHKLQTIELLAVAICVYQKFPNARMSLNVRHDFMGETRDFEKEMAGEGEGISDGSLRISPACRLYLSQAGFDFPDDAEPATRMTDSELARLAQVFFKSQVSKLARGA